MDPVYKRSPPPYNSGFVTSVPLSAAPFHTAVDIQPGQVAPHLYVMHEWPNTCTPFPPPAETLDYQSRLLADLIDLDSAVICEPPHCYSAPANFDICRNHLGQRWRVFRAEEEMIDCSADCGLVRGFVLTFKNQRGQEVLVLRRPSCHCLGWCLPCCCLDTMTVESPPGNVIGCIREDWTLFGTSLTVTEPHGEPIFKVTAECCAATKASENRQATKFKIMDTRSSSEAGEIIRQFSPSSGSEYVYNTIHVSFAAADIVQWKALKIAAAILLNYRLFSLPAQAQEQTD